MRNFKIISDEMYAVKKAGYALDFDKSYPQTDIKPRALENAIEFENRMGVLYDDFYDLDAAWLCEDENGDKYAVLHTWEGDIWQPLKKV